MYNILQYAIHMLTKYDPTRRLNSELSPWFTISKHTRHADQWFLLKDMISTIQIIISVLNLLETLILSSIVLLIIRKHEFIYMQYFKISYLINHWGV